MLFPQIVLYLVQVKCGYAVGTSIYRNTEVSALRNTEKKEYENNVR